MTPYLILAFFVGCFAFYYKLALARKTLKFCSAARPVTWGTAAFFGALSTFTLYLAFLGLTEGGVTGLQTEPMAAIAAALLVGLLLIVAGDEVLRLVLKTFVAIPPEQEKDYAWAGLAANRVIAHIDEVCNERDPYHVVSQNARCVTATHNFEELVLAMRRGLDIIERDANEDADEANPRRLQDLRNLVDSGITLARYEIYEYGDLEQAFITLITLLESETEFRDLYRETCSYSRRQLRLHPLRFRPRLRKLQASWYNRLDAI